MEIMRILAAVPLQCPQVIGVAQFGAQLFENGPVPFGTVGADFTVKVLFQIGGDTVSIQ